MDINVLNNLFFPLDFSSSMYVFYILDACQKWGILLYHYRAEPLPLQPSAYMVVNTTRNPTPINWTHKCAKANSVVLQIMFCTTGAAL